MGRISSVEGIIGRKVRIYGNHVYGRLIIGFGLGDAQGDGSLKPHDIQAIQNFVSAHRTSDTPFDLVAAGNSAGDDRARARAQIEPFESAGATWWVEFISPGPGESEQALTRIKQGPPR